MDIFDIDGDPEDGVRLLETALAAVVPAGETPPEYGRFLPPDWREHPSTRQAVEDRMAALERVGAKPFVERLRLEWRPGTPVAGLSGRLAFRPVRDPGEPGDTVVTADTTGLLVAAFGINGKGHRRGPVSN